VAPSSLIPRASVDWQIVLPDGTALGDFRCTLKTMVAIFSTSDRKERVTVALSV
jgi:hypothetical protein